MMEFSGILNDNGVEKNMSIYLDLSIAPTSFLDRLYIDHTVNKSYNTLVSIDHVQLDATIENDFCNISNSIYQYNIEYCADEIIVVAKEVTGIFHFLFPCIMRPKFFVVSNMAV